MVELLKSIEINHAVMLGKPVIKGTRITVELILRKVSGGYSFEDILEMYPHLQIKDILTCVEYATKEDARQFITINKNKIRYRRI
jgi:uncharacterized protein (DUF433 family)